VADGSLHDAALSHDRCVDVAPVVFDRSRVGPAEAAVLGAMALQVVTFVRYIDIYLRTGIYV
jgi:hypothetical protein